MNVIYNFAVNAINGALNIYARCVSDKCQGKFSRFLTGRRNLMNRIRDDMNQMPRKGMVVWFHASSLGEYAVARPLIARLHRECECTVVFTFFSPSGYEPLRDRHPGIDYLYYLPIDTRHNACEFLDAVRPDRAVFIISELWPNFLQQLKFRAIPTYLVSAIIRENSSCFRWYGKTFRKALFAFTKIFVLNEESRFNLKMFGYTNAEVNGDPLFDNASLVASTEWNDEVISNFTSGHKVFMAGSVSDDKDADMVCHVANSHSGLRSILVPHDISEKGVAQLQSRLKVNSKLYSECDTDTDFTDTDVLIVNSMGKLAYMYRYATVAYVGGGFTPLLHSVIEATVYGVPVSFGPRIERKITPAQLMKSGLGQMVTTPAELDTWVWRLINDDTRLDEIKAGAREYVKHNTGNVEFLIRTIINGQ